MKYKNALFSNQPNFYQEYLSCFDKPNSTKKDLKVLIQKVQLYYKVKFNFDEYFLEYPHFKASGKYSDLQSDRAFR